MKVISFGLVIVIFVSLLAFSSYGFELRLDGTINNREWEGAAIYNVIDESLQSNCNIDFATLFCITDEINYSVFLAFKYMSEDFDSLNNNSAIEIRVNDSDCIIFYANGDEMKIDYDKFDAEHIFSFNEKSKETYCEMRLGIKYGVKEDIVLGIRIFDYMGRPSNYYEIKIFEVTDIVGGSPEPSKFVPETTTETTTKITTTKATTTKPTTTKTTTSQKSVSECENTTQSHKTTTSVISAYTTAMSTTEKEIVTEPTTVKGTEKSKKESVTEKSETTTKITESETKLSQTDIVTEELISKAISDMEVQKATDRKTVGYSVASAVLVSAVFVTVVATMSKTANGKKKENFDEEDL